MRGECENDNLNESMRVSMYKHKRMESKQFILAFKLY